MQRTRLRQVMGESLRNLALWAANPWRYMSLLAVISTTAFLLGNVVTTISGALNLLDPMAAMALMALMEVLVRQRPRLQRQRNHLWLHLVDAFRMSFLYGIIRDGFRLMAV